MDFHLILNPIFAVSVIYMIMDSLHFSTVTNSCVHICAFCRANWSVRIITPLLLLGPLSFVSNCIFCYSSCFSAGCNGLEMPWRTSIGWPLYRNWNAAYYHGKQDGKLLLLLFQPVIPFLCLFLLWLCWRSGWRVQWPACSAPQSNCWS